MLLQNIQTHSAHMADSGRHDFFLLLEYYKMLEKPVFCNLNMYSYNVHAVFNS